MAHYRVLFVLAAGLGYVHASNVEEWRKNRFTVNCASGSAYCPSTTALQRFGKYGIPRRDVILRYNDFEISYDNRNRQPNWVLEHLTRAKLDKPVPKWSPEPEGPKSHRSPSAPKCPTKPMCPFRIDNHPDPRVPKFFQSSCEDFGNSYWTGRLAADNNYEFNRLSKNDTFTYTNFSPQDLSFIYGPWEDIECYARYTTYCYKDVYVFTGPLFLPKREDKMHYDVTDCHSVGVPTHFFKIIIGQTECNEFHVSCFLVPNARVAKRKDIDNYFLELEELEYKAGFKLFKHTPPFCGPLSNLDDFIEMQKCGNGSGHEDDEDEDQEMMKPAKKFKRREECD